MKDIRSIHRKAIDLAKQAKQSLDERDMEQYLALSKQAFELEREAAIELVNDFDSEPTRSVLFRSAATLAYNCGLYTEAGKLIFTALEGKPHTEIKTELNALLLQVNMALSLSMAPQEAAQNAYILMLRDKAVNIKIEPKTHKYSNAVVVNQIVDFLRNVQNSYKGFTEVMYRKLFSNEEDVSDENIVKIRSGSNLIAVDVAFGSFGISVVSDAQIMDLSNIAYTQDFIQFRQKLFEEFAQDVLLPDYNSAEFQSTTNAKYTSEEKHIIYSPIVNALQSSEYKVSITDSGFKKIIKTHPTITRDVKQIFAPKLEKPAEDATGTLEQKYILRRGGKSSTILTEDLDYAEFKVPYAEANDEEKSISFSGEYEVKVIFENGIFSISDTTYNINIEDNEFKSIQKKFASELIKKYTELLQNRANLNADELEVLTTLENNTMRNW